MAQTIWSGFDVSFTKPDTGDVNDPANQDRITDNVWLTRGGTGGIYNINQESFYATNISPTDTEWATEVVPENEGEPIVATNWEDLTFTDWRTSYGGMFALLENIILVPAVVHLITDDVYLDVQFTSWTQGGGGFSYDRGDGTVPPPTSGDYNGNGVVDAADYVVWRKTLNQPAVPAGSGADGNSSGRIDEGDVNIWRHRFADTVPGSGSGVHARGVPEPSAILHFAIGLLALRWFLARYPKTKN
jgi:hypothetical protein